MNITSPPIGAIKYHPIIGMIVSAYEIKGDNINGDAGEVNVQIYYVLFDSFFK